MQRTKGIPESTPLNYFLFYSPKGVFKISKASFDLGIPVFPLINTPSISTIIPGTLIFYLF